jgi:hypothetical protein
MNPLVLFIMMVLACAAMLTAHVAIVIGLAKHIPRYRALVAVVAPPLGAYWAIRAKQHVRGGVWIIATTAYLVLRLVG